MENNFFQQVFTAVPDFSSSLQVLFGPQPSFWDNPEHKSKKKTRGRKKLRPGNPLKTEVMDKYWLRSFRNYIRSQFFSIKAISEDKDFWQWYISKGKPGRNSNFLSYNKDYKEKLFGNSSFCAMFAAWGMSNGYCLNLKNNLKESWRFYFEYFLCELVPKAFSLAVVEEFNRFFSFVSEEVAKKGLEEGLENFK